MRASDKKLRDAMMAAGMPENLVRRAAEGEWNNYFGIHALPQHALLLELSVYKGTERLREAVIRGDFDGTREESDE